MLRRFPKFSFLRLSLALALLGWVGWLVAQESSARLPGGRPDPLRRPRRPAALPSGYSMVVPGYWVLGMDAIQDEVGLTDEQKFKLKDLSDKYQALVQKNMARIGELSPQEQEKRMPELREQANELLQAARKRVQAVLTPKQAQAAQQIEFQLQVAGAAMSPEVQKPLALTETQRKQIQQAFNDATVKALKLQRETGERVLGILSPEQVEALRQQLEGPPPRRAPAGR